MPPVDKPRKAWICTVRSFQWVLCATRGQVMKSMKAMKANPMKARKSPNPKSKAKVRKAVVKQAKTSGVFQRSWKKFQIQLTNPCHRLLFGMAHVFDAMT